MKIVNYDEPFEVRMNLRMNQRQFETLVKYSNALGKSPSATIRLLIDSLGGTSNENVKTDRDNFIQYGRLS